MPHPNRCSNAHPHASSKSCTCDRCLIQEWIWLYSFWDCSKGFRNFHANRSCTANMRLELASFAILHKQTGTFSLLLAWRDLILHFNPLPVICNWIFRFKFEACLVYDTLKAQIWLKVYSHEINFPVLGSQLCTNLSLLIGIFFSIKNPCYPGYW